MSEAKANPELERKKCQTIYWNLLMLLDDEIEATSAPHYLREFVQTAQCENLDGERSAKELREAREKVQEHTTPEVWKKIVVYNEGVQETNRALQAMIHYRTWHHSLLLSALDWKGYFNYYFFHKAEKVSSGLGLIALSYGGVRGATRGYKRFFENQTKAPLRRNNPDNQ